MDGFGVVVHVLPAAALQEIELLPPILGHERIEPASKDLFGAIAEQLFGSLIPAFHDTIGRHGQDADRGCPDDGGERIRDILARKRTRARQHLGEHAAERPDVRALVDGLSLRLLGCHVGRGAENQAQP